MTTLFTAARRSLLLAALICAVAWGGPVRAQLAPFAQPSAEALADEETWAQLLRFVVRQLNAPGEYEIDLGTISTGENDAIRIDALAISDSEGVWLQAEGLEVEWNSATALVLDVVFDRISVERLVVARPPVARGDPPSREDPEAGLEAAWPRAPVNLEIGRFEIVEIDLAAPVLGERVLGSLSGLFSDRGDVQRAALQFERVNEERAHLRFESLLDLDQDKIDVVLEVGEEAGGLVGAMIGAPTEAALKLDVKAAGSSQQLNFSVDAVATDALNAAATGSASWAEAFSVDIVGTAEAGRLADAALRGAVGERAELRLSFAEQADGAFRIDAFDLTSRALQISASGLVDPEADRIDFEAAIASPDPVALAGVAGLEEIGRLEGTANAKGSLSAPDATAMLSIDGLKGSFGEIARVEVAASATPEDRASRVALDVALTGAEMADADLRDLFGAEPALSARGRYDAGATSARLDRLDISAAAFQGGGSAALSLDRLALDAKLDLAFQTVRPLLSLAGVEGTGRGQIGLEIAGASADTVQRAELSAEFDALSFAEPALAALIGDRVEMALALEDDGQGAIEVTEGRMRTVATAFSVDGALSPASDTVALSVSGEVTDATAVTRAVSSVAVETFDFEIALGGALSAPRVAFDAAVAGLAVPDLSVERAEASAEFELQRDERTPFRLELKTSGAASPSPELAAILGAQPSFQARGSFDRALGRLALEEATLDAAAARALAQGVVGADAFGEDRITLEYRIEAPDLGVVGPFAGQALLVGRAEGLLSAPVVSGRLSSDRIEAEGLLLVDLALDYASKNLGGDAPSVRVDLAAGLNDAPLTAGLSVVLGAGGPALDDIAARYLGAELAGAVALDGAAAVGELHLSAADLSAFADLVGVSISGDADAAAQLGKSADGAQTLTLAASGAEVAVEDVSFGGWRARMDGEVDVFDFELSASEFATGPIQKAELLIGGRTTLEEARMRVVLDRLAIETVAALTRASQPISVLLQDGQVSVQAPTISATAKKSGDTGRISAAVDLQDGEIRGDLRLDRFPLALLDAFELAPIEGGRLDGDVSIEPGRGSAKLRVDRAIPKLSTGAPISADLEVGWADEALEAALSARIGPGAPLRANVRLPITPGTLPTLDETKPFAGDLKWSGRAADVIALLPLEGHILEGDVSVNLAASGALEAPSFSGDARLRNGRYIAVNAGLAFADLDISLVADGRTLRIDGRGTDGGQGRLRVSGSVDPFAGRTEIRAEAVSARLIQRDDLKATASADVSVRLGGEAPGIRGGIVIETAEARLVESGVVEPALIEYRVRGDAVEDAAADKAAARPVVLDLAITAPQRVYVRGRGLDSEWGGALKVGGTLDAPSVAGALQARRGQFTLAGAPFQLVRGLVSFQGAIDPIVAVRLELERNGVLGAIAVEGPASNLEMRLSSTPELPEDEVLPRLIFGEAPSQISPLEAAQLAAGLSTLLNGDESALDVARRLIGVDSLSVGEGAAGDPVVSVGRYISDRVYVEGRSGVEPSDRSVAVEIEVTPSIDVESEIGAEGNVGVGLQWRKDY